MKYTKRAISFLLIATMLLALIPAAIPIVSAVMSRPEVWNAAGTLNATGGNIAIVPGNKLLVNGTGVTSGTTIEVYWDTVILSAQVNATTGNPDTSFSCLITVPDTAAGAHYVWVRDSSTAQTANSVYLTISHTVKLDPTSGLAGDDVAVTGRGFAASKAVQVYFNNTEVVAYSASVKTNSVGTFSKTFKVPTSAIWYGGHQVMANVSGTVANETFTIGAAITLSADEGPAGMILTISGRGFAHKETIQNNAGNITLGSAAMFLKTGTSFETSSTGTFSIPVVVPSLAVTSYTLTVTDGTDSATDTFEVTGTSALSLSQAYGTPGTIVTVTGANFTKVSGISVNINILGSTYATATTDANGAFSKVISLPALGLGAQYAVWGNDTRNCNATTNVLIALIMLQLNVNSGPVGSNVTLSGTGFNNTGGAEYNASMGGIQIIDNTNTANNYFSAVFQVPTLPSGTYTITVLDVVADIEVTTSFTVTDQATLTPSVTQAPNQYNLSIAGANFANIAGKATTWWIYNSTYTLQIDPQYGISSAVCDVDGEFTGYWKVPWYLELGTYTINCTTATSAEIEQYAETTIELVVETYTYAPSRGTYARGESITWNIRAMFAKDLELGIKDADGNDNFNTTWAPGVWTQSGTIWYIPVALQGLISVPDDATPGTWVYEFTNSTSGDVYASGTITIKEKTDVQELMDAVAANTAGLTSVSDAVSDLINTVDTVSGAVSEASAAAANAASAAAAAKAAADAAAAAVGDVGDTAQDALDAANDAKSAADAAKDAADSGLAAALDAVAKAQQAADAAIDAKDAADESRSATSGLTGLVYGAIGASLIAALAAIVSLMQISRRIAG